MHGLHQLLIIFPVFQQILHGGASHVLLTFASPTAVCPFFLQSVTTRDQMVNRERRDRRKCSFLFFFLIRILWYIIFFSGAQDLADVCREVASAGSLGIKIGEIWIYFTPQPLRNERLWYDRGWSCVYSILFVIRSCNN